MRLGKAPVCRDLPLLGIKVALCHFQIDDQYLVRVQGFYCLKQVCSRLKYLYNYWTDCVDAVCCTGIHDPQRMSIITLDFFDMCDLY